MNILILLLRLKGHEEVLNFIEHHFFLVHDVCVEGQYLYWAQILCDELTSWMNSAKVFKQFYMSSYMIYALATYHLWSGLTYNEAFDESTKVYEFYPCLQLERSYE